MHVVLISSSRRPTPPTGTAGAELAIAHLAQALAARGHSVVVHATGGSRLRGVQVVSHVRRPTSARDPLAELVHFRSAWHDVMSSWPRPDVVHVHDAAALAMAPPDAPPTVLTVHDDDEHLDGAAAVSTWREQLRPATCVAVSEQLAASTGADEIVHPALDESAYPFGPGLGGYAAYLGDLTRDRAPHVAIDAVRAAGLALRLGGEPRPDAAGEYEYFAREIRPRIVAAGQRALDWLGAVSAGPRLEVLRHARALVCPAVLAVDLPMLEAMLVGTPIVAARSPLAEEIVDEGVTGFLFDTPEEAIEQLRALHAFDRAACRARALERWAAARAASLYEEIYARVTVTRDLPFESIVPREPEPMVHAASGDFTLHDFLPASMRETPELQRRQSGARAVALPLSVEAEADAAEAEAEAVASSGHGRRAR